MQTFTNVWRLMGRITNKGARPPLLLANLGQAVLTRPIAVLAQHELINIWSGTDGVDFLPCSCVG